VCGRFSLRALLDDLRRHLQDEYQIERISDDIWVPRYNLAPGQEVLSVLHDGKSHRAGRIKWGFVPVFAKEEEKSKTGIINAKAETLAERPAFRDSLAKKRCVILADGFYEWKKDGKTKTPMRILMKDEIIFPLAGLWNTVVKADGTKVSTCTIVTTTPNGLVSQIHDRMPAILTPEAEKVWLDPRVTDPRILLNLLRPFEEDAMKAYPVSDLVNHANIDIPECIRPL